MWVLVPFNDAFEVQFFSGLHFYTLPKTLIACRAMQLRFFLKRKHNNAFKILEEQLTLISTAFWPSTIPWNASDASRVHLPSYGENKNRADEYLLNFLRTIIFKSPFSIQIKVLHRVLLPQSLDSVSILHSQCTFSAPRGAFRPVAILQARTCQLNHNNFLIQLGPDFYTWVKSGNVDKVSC